MKILLFKVGILWSLYWLYIIHNEVKAVNYSAPIISGYRAAIGQFPWHVLLRRDADDELLCGGSIISTKWVLTAAHCIYNMTFVHLEFGTINLYFDGLVMNSTKFYIYPEYNHNSTNDIGLIELPEPLEFSVNINAIELISAEEASTDLVGDLCTITGFGWTMNTGNNSQWLLYAEVDVIANNICASAYHLESIEDTAMCTEGYAGSSQTPCKGDSGGALVWKNEQFKRVQVGVASFMMLNQCSEFPAGFTKVAKYLDFIYNITGINNQTDGK
ncbi:collagenase-like [Lucilia sericata]|uniref:collagenase-like n=1 Tax=Lucilia sericata TaxID=13632 RepID=UPI0018A80BA0|nr:collagenase-like [Lucilia sericata]